MHYFQQYGFCSSASEILISRLLSPRWRTGLKSVGAGAHGRASPPVVRTYPWRCSWGRASGRKGVCLVDNHRNCENKSESENGHLEVNLHQGHHGGDGQWMMNIGYGDSYGNVY